MNRSAKLALLSALALTAWYAWSEEAQGATVDSSTSGSDWLAQLQAALADAGSLITGAPASIAGPGEANTDLAYASGASGLPTAGEASGGLFDRITGGVFDMGENWRVGEYPAYAAAIAATERAYGIPADLLARQLYQESHYRADIISGQKRSPAGAAGIAQFMPGTAGDYGVNPLDPLASIDAAGRYMRDLYRRFESWSDALAAYNWGMGNVAKWKAGERAMPSETVKYVAQITADVRVT